MQPSYCFNCLCRINSATPRPSKSTLLVILKYVFFRTLGKFYSNRLGCLCRDYNLFCMGLFACFGMVFPYPFANLSVATPNAMGPNCFDILQRPFASLGCQPRGYRFKPTLAIFLTMSKNVAGRTSLSLSLTYRVWSIQTGQYFRSLDPYTRKTFRFVYRFVFP